MIRLPAGEVLRQVGAAVRLHQPDTSTCLPRIVSWSEGIQKAAVAIQDPESDVFLIHPHNSHQKEILRQTALENVRLDRETSHKTTMTGLPIRTSYDISTVPYPKAPSKEVREKLKEEALKKENIPQSPNSSAPYVITLRAGVEDRALPTIQSHIRISPVEDEETSELLQNAKMVWDTGAHKTIISEDLLSDELRRCLEKPDNDPYRSESGLSVQVTMVVGFSNSPVEIETIALVCPRHLMPDHYSGILFGQSGCIDSLVYTSTPRKILLLQGEEVSNDIWGDITLSAYADMFDNVLHTF